MVESKPVQVRFKPDAKNALLKIQKFAGFKTMSATVRQLVDTGLSFYKHRENAIAEMQEQIRIFTIKPQELYPEIKLKRKYLGR